MWKIVRLYYGLRLSWRLSSKNVPVAIGGPLLPCSVHLQPKQLLVTVTVLSLPFVADYIIEAGKGRQTVLISCFLPCLRRWRSAFLSPGLWKFATRYSRGGQGVALNRPPPLKLWMTQPLPFFSKTRSADECGPPPLPCGVEGTGIEPCCLRSLSCINIF